MGRDVALSWIDELSPMPPTPRALAGDLLECWGEYRAEGLPRRTRLVFCGLRASQRIAYWLGWQAGARGRG